MNLEINRNGCISMENKFYLTGEKNIFVAKSNICGKALI